jgi:hypothetical protein
LKGGNWIAWLLPLRKRKKEKVEKILVGTSGSGDDDLVELLIHRPGVQARLFFIKVKCWKEAICLALLKHDSFPWAKPAFQQSSRVFFYPNLFKTPSSPFSHLFYLVSLCMISRARNVAVVPRVSF